MIGRLLFWMTIGLLVLAGVAVYVFVRLVLGLLVAIGYLLLCVGAWVAARLLSARSA